MATDTRDLLVKINADDSNASAVLGKFSSHVDSIGGKVKDSLNVAAKSFAVVSAAAVGFAAESVKSFSESEDMIAQTNAVLKSTGQVAGVTAKQVDDLSKSLERQTKYSDEDVRSVENLLLTFTSIGKDVFPQATKTVLDMATALGEDTKSASIQLGKALQDPILGITALRRVGVNFSDAQKDVIQKLVDTNQKAEAQKLILKELNTEFGGSAVAAGNTFSGSLAKLNNQFDDLKELIGEFIVATTTPLLTTFNKWIDKAGGVDGIMQSLKTDFDKMKAYIPEISGAILAVLAPAFFEAAIGAGAFLLAVSPFITAGVLLGKAAHDAGFKMDDLRIALDKIKIYANDAKIGLRLIKETIFDNGPVLQMGEDRFLGIANALITMRQAVVRVITYVQELYKWFTNLTPVIIIGQFIQQVFVPALAAIGAAIWQNLLPALKQLGESLVRLWNSLNPALSDALKIIGGLLGGLVLAAVWGFLAGLNVLVQVFSMVVSAISNVINWISNLISWFGNLVGVVWNTIKTVITIFGNLTQATKDVVGVVVGIFATLGSMVLHAVGDLASLLYDAGKDLVGGFVRGIKDTLKEVADVVGNVGTTAVSKIKNVLGIHSPSRVFADIGENMGQGLINGLTGKVEDVQLATTAMVAPGVNQAASQTIAPQAPAPTTSSNVTLQINVGMYAGMPVEKRQIALELYKELVRAARSQGVSLPMIGAVGVQ